MTALALASVQCCVLRGLCARLIVPLVYVVAAILEALQWELRLVVWVECREPVVTRRAVEQNHVTQHSLTCQHSTQELLTECSMNLSCPDGYVVCAARGDDRGELRKIFPLELTIAKSTFSIEDPLHGARNSFVKKKCTFMFQGT